jgi:hypothetical protein
VKIGPAKNGETLAISAKRIPLNSAPAVAISNSRNFFRSLAKMNLLSSFRPKLADTLNHHSAGELFAGFTAGIVALAFASACGVKSS